MTLRAARKKPVFSPVTSSPFSSVRMWVNSNVLPDAVVALASGGALAAKVSAQSNRVEAIVLTENAYVRSGPGDANPRLAEIHEGLKVRVISEREGWYQVTLANGLTGWLRASELETI